MTASDKLRAFRALRGYNFFYFYKEFRKMLLEVIDIDGELGFIMPEKFHQKLGIKDGVKEIGVIDQRNSCLLVPIDYSSPDENFSDA